MTIVLMMGSLMVLTATRQAYFALAYYSAYVSRMFLCRIFCGLTMLTSILLFVIYAAMFDHIPGSKLFHYFLIANLIIVYMILIWISIISNRIYGGRGPDSRHESGETP
jgi:hypothetical protein